MPDSTHSPTDAPAPEGDREVLMVPADRVLASATSMHDLAALPAEQVPIVVVLRAARLLYDDARSWSTPPAAPPATPATPGIRSATN